MPRLTSLIAAALVALPLHAEILTDDQMDKLASDLRTSTGAPAIIIASANAQGRAVGVSGERAAGSGVAATTKDHWHVASNTKAMTATLIARLAEQGMISWDDTVGGVLGSQIPEIDTAYAQATYADLLAHRTGLPANIGLLKRWPLMGLDATRDTPADRIAYAKTALSTSPDSSAPHPFKYSNAAYVVVGAMLEVTTGTSWEDLITTHVFEPLGMATPGFGPPGSIDEIDQPRGHKSKLLGGWSPQAPEAKADNIPAMSPAGRVNITMDDFLSFLQAHAARDPEFLSPDSWARLHQPKEGEDYVAGWVVAGDTITHNGSNTLWYSHGGVNLATGKVAAIVANAEDQDAIDKPVAAQLKALLSAP